MAVSKRLRFEILRRDNHACRYCGLAAGDAWLEIDHVVPKTLGGTDDPTNLVAACVDCNAGKGSIAPGSPLIADVASDAFRWARAMRFAIEEARERRAEVEEAIDVVDAAWGRYGWNEEDGRRLVSRPADWRESIELIWGAGMRDLDFMVRSVDKAMHKPDFPNDQRWVYWCGCCWGHLKDIQKRAAELLASEDVDGTR